MPTSKNFILDYVHPVPDLWGPFWISVTLVFSIGVFGNIAQYIQNDGSPGEYGSDFRLVTSSATLVFLYVVVVPIILSTILWQRKAELQYAISDLLCAYGYSLSIFIPVSMLWTLDVNWFRWVLIIAAVSLSGAVLVKALWPAFKSDPSKLVAYGSIFGVILLHFLLAFTFKVYFFDAVHPLSEKTVPVPEHKATNDSATMSNSQVLVSGKIEQMLSTKSPIVPKDVTETHPEKVKIIKTNNLTQEVKQQKDQSQASNLNGSAAPAVHGNSTG
ncbi:Yip1 domain-containing protein [Trichostrongylus colubriformis]